MSRKADRVLERTREATIEMTSELVLLELGEAARALYGLDDAEVLGRSLSEVLLTDSGPIDWAGHWAGVLAGKPFEQIMLHRSSSGLRLWVLARLEAHPEGARLWVRQASGREVLERQPGGAVQALSNMLAVGGVGVWMDDRITDEFNWSEQARRLHDLPLEGELTPQMLFGQIHPDDRSKAAAEIQRGIAERLPYDGVIRYKHGHGEYRHLRVFGGATYDDDGLALLSLGGVVDVSEELALRRRVRELEDQLRAAQRGDVVGRLAGGVAHDFNNILTGILGCCEMLALGSLSAEQRADVQQIRAATLRAGDLTRQLLAFGRRQALRRRAVAPGAVLADVVALLRRTVPENVEMRLLPSDTPGRVLVDVTQLHQVLTNLVVNAAQAMPSGGTIEIGASQVAWQAEGRSVPEPFVRFVVEDTGPGVPDELRPRIFEPFFSTKPPGQGSGLGLSVVQGIVDQHQGHICVQSGALGGARFEVFLPVTERTPELPSELPHSGPASTALNMRVLLVEDEKMVRELTKRILVGEGVEVIEAADAEEGLMRAYEAPFDVLLTDVVLPKMSGPELAMRLRDRGLEFRCVYMSGYPADFVESRVHLGENEVLVHKPFTASALLLALRHRLG
jgi:two-component system, cell cycle sensor histidine kinase and response regulator CckA